MYNRYIPQPDGSYRRRAVPDPKPTPKPCPPPEPEDCKPEPKPEPRKQNHRRPQPPHHSPHRQRYQPKNPPPTQSVPEGFLSGLLPKNLDTVDLLVMALLLLMAGDCQEDKSTALLTLALYLFL